MHVQYHAFRKAIDNVKQKNVFYALCALYMLSAAVIALDIAGDIAFEVRNNKRLLFSSVLISCAEK